MKRALLFLALCLTLSGIGLFAGGKPAPPKPTMPLLGDDGYCVTVEGSPFLVNVPGHFLDVPRRQKENARRAQEENWRGEAKGTRGRLSLDRTDIEAEYRESVGNAFGHAARLSGNPKLIAALGDKLVFHDLGDIQIDGAKPAPTVTCMKSSCYGQPRGCVVTGCLAGCADCAYVRTPSIE